MLSYNQWKVIVSERVNEVAFSELSASLQESSKLKNLKYDSFQCQSYMEMLDARTARRIARFRSRTLFCKRNHKDAYKDLSCRACGDTEETQEHVINCRQIHGKVDDLDLSFMFKMDEVKNNLRVLQEVMSRMDTLEEFMNLSLIHISEPTRPY